MKTVAVLLGASSPNANGSTRRQHRFADGQRSRGYIALEVETVRASVSCEALGFMARIRDLIDQREGDGLIKASAVRALGVELEIETRVPGLLQELAAAELLRKVGDGYQDVRFLVWSASRAERESSREQWRDRAEASRRDTPRDTQRGSRA